MGQPDSLQGDQNPFRDACFNLVSCIHKPSPGGKTQVGWTSELARGDVRDCVSVAGLRG